MLETCLLLVLISEDLQTEVLLLNESKWHSFIFNETLSKNISTVLHLKQNNMNVEIAKF